MVPLAVVLVIMALCAGPADAFTRIVRGDIIASQGDGMVNEYSPDGTLVQTLITHANSPTGSAFDAQGNLYVSEFVGNDMLKVDAQTGAVSVFSNDSILGDGTAFNFPHSIAFGPGYTKIYVSDTNRLGIPGGGGIHVIDASTGKGIGFYPLPSSLGDLHGTVVGESSWLAFSASGVLYTTNENPTQGIMQVDQSTGDIVQPSFVANLPNYGNAMSFDASGNLWLDDYDSIQEYSPTGSLLRNITNPSFISIFAGAFDPSFKTFYAGQLGGSFEIFSYDLNGNLQASFNTESGVQGLSVAGTVLPGAGGPTTISNVTPNWAPYRGGTTVTITGTNFGTSPAVQFSDSCDTPNTFQKPAPVVSASDKKIVVSVPAATSVAFPDALLNVAEIYGPGCLDIFTAAGGHASVPFTYVVPQIGELVYQLHAPNKPDNFSDCAAEMVHSSNQSVVITAAHCLSEDGYEAYDFAFAPGYFGSQCAAAPDMGSSLRFGCGAATPYGIWCAKSNATSYRSHGLYFAADPGCGNVSGTAHPLPGFVNRPDNDDFAVLTMGASHPAPSTQRKPGCPQGTSTTKLEACIGGGLNVAWDAGGNIGSASRQAWNLFGYVGPYLKACTADPDPVSGSDFGQRDDGLLQISNVDSGPCSWVANGDSGGAWLNNKNGFTDGMGALNKGRNPNLIGGTYLGTKARALWNSAQHLPAP